MRGSRNQAVAVMQMANEQGARVLSMQPVRETLEEVFLKHVEGKRRDLEGSEA